MFFNLVCGVGAAALHAAGAMEIPPALKWGLAGLLARKPRALILDEPLAGLDGASQQGLLQLLVDLRRRERLTVVVISHDFAGLEELCPRILHLENGVLAATPTAAGGMS